MAKSKRPKDSSKKTDRYSNSKPTLSEEQSTVEDGRGFEERKKVTSILAMDPGKVNFSWVYWLDGVKQYGWVTPIVDVNNDTEFLNCIIELLTKFNPDHIVLERFMVRNKGQSIHAESINQMIGRIAAIVRTHAGKDLIQLTAAQWKTHWLKKWKEDWSVTYSSMGSIHQRDAAAMARYVQEVWIENHLIR